MPSGLNYSKWDNLELSDDSDIEVHPNVDKKSFIRWKQRDIHEKRDIRKSENQQLKAESENNKKLAGMIKTVGRIEKGRSLEGSVRKKRWREQKNKIRDLSRIQREIVALLLLLSSPLEIQKEALSFVLPFPVYFPQ